MAEVTYHFNARGEAAWTDPDNIVDNNLETFGHTTSSGLAQVLTGNTCPGTDLGTILKVELRVYAYGDGNDKIGIRPFWQDYGSSYLEVMLTSPGWSEYFDITNDPYAPDWSSWSHIQETDCWIWRIAVRKGNPMYCAKVEIRVTYGDEEAVAETTYNTKVGSPTSWGWEKCDYGGAEKCPVGSELIWIWQAPIPEGPNKTPQGGPLSFIWGSE